jgi:hypothetical protein
MEDIIQSPPVPFAPPGTRRMRNPPPLAVTPHPKGLGILPEDIEDVEDEEGERLNSSRKRGPEARAPVYNYGDPNVQNALGSGVTATAYVSNGMHRDYLRRLYPKSTEFVYKWIYGVYNNTVDDMKDRKSREKFSRVLLDEISVHQGITLHFKERLEKNPNLPYPAFVPLVEWVFFMERFEGASVYRYGVDSVPIDPDYAKYMALSSFEDDDTNEKMTKDERLKHFSKYRWITERRMVTSMDHHTALQGKLKNQGATFKPSTQFKKTNTRTDYIAKVKNSKKIRYIERKYEMKYGGNIVEVNHLLTKEDFMAVGAYTYMPRMDGILDHWVKFMTRTEFLNKGVDQFENRINAIRERFRMVFEVFEFVVEMNENLSLWHGDLHLANMLMTRDEKGEIHICVNDFGRTEYIIRSKYKTIEEYYDSIRYNNAYDLYMLLDNLVDYVVLRYVALDKDEVPQAYEYCYTHFFHTYVPKAEDYPNTKDDPEVFDREKMKRLGEVKASTMLQTLKSLEHLVLRAYHKAIPPEDRVSEEDHKRLSSERYDLWLQEMAHIEGEKRQQ